MTKVAKTAASLRTVARKLERSASEVKRIERKALGRLAVERELVALRKAA